MPFIGKKQAVVTVRVDGREYKVAYEGLLTDENAIKDYVVNATKISATNTRNPDPQVELVDFDKGDGSEEMLPHNMQPTVVKE